MVTTAVAQADVFALRRKIAKIEGRLPEQFAVSPGTDKAAVVLRRHGVASSENFFLRSGAEKFDAALGGGLERAALTEIHGAETRDAGAAAGFALALIGLILKDMAIKAPILWIGTAEIFREAGYPYALGLQERFGIGPEKLLLSEAPKLTDALWIAEEAARLKALSAVLLELRGNPQGLDLTATRRLHRRAQEAGRPVFLLRQSALAEPTAAPVRLIVSPAPAALRQTIGGPLARSIGPPRFTVTVGKSRLALPGQFELEWNPDERSFQERRLDRSQSESSVAVVSLSRHRANTAAAPRTIMAFKSGNVEATPRHQPPGEQHPAHRRPRRAG